jgi:hypothetical protein
MFAKPSARTGALALALVIPIGAYASIVDVSPSNMNGWGLHDYLDQPGNTSASSFVNGPGTPPLGSGSLHFSVTTGDDVNRATTNAYDGIRVSTITALSYDTYQAGSLREQDPYLRIYVNWDGSSTSQDDAWYFEPTYTNSLYGVSGITNQAIVANQWQHWDTMTGAWYSEIADGGYGPGSNATTFANLLALHPNATIVPRGDGFGGVRLSAGGGAPDWNDFDGNVDNFTFGVNGNNTTYNFEAVPEPTSMVALGLGAIALIRKRRAK